MCQGNVYVVQMSSRQTKRARGTTRLAGHRGNGTNRPPSILFSNRPASTYRESLQAALDANRTLQKQILEELDRLFRSAACHRSLLSKKRREVCVDACISDFSGIPDNGLPVGVGGDVPTKSSILQLLDSDTENRLKRKRCSKDDDDRSSASKPKKYGDDDGDSVVDIFDGDYLTAYTESRSPVKPHERQKGSQKNRTGGKNPENSWTVLKRRCYNYDPYRRWDRSFFFDPYKSTPAPNVDLERRNEILSKSFYFHTTPPWSKRQLDVLRTVTGLKEVRQNSNANEKHDEKKIDFDNVAQQFAKKHALLRDTAIPTTARGRTPSECKMAYQHLLSSSPKLTKQESMYILEQVHLSESSYVPHWASIAAALNEKTGPRSSKWTPFTCCSRYQTQLRPKPAIVMTETESKVLLAFIAATGPQFVLDIANVGHLGSRLFPIIPPKLLLHRTGYTMLNPKATNGTWTDEEERKLALCMKVYAGASDTSTSLAALHHFPYRSSPSVKMKWSNQLSPEYTWRAFTKEEDETLVRMVRVAEGKALFTELVRQQMPSRHPSTVYARWRKLASTEDMANLYRGLVISRGAKQGAVGDGTLLRSDDFVLQLKEEK